MTINTSAFFLIIALSGWFSASAQTDVVRYRIALEKIDITGSELKGVATIVFNSKQSSTLQLMLHALTVDMVEHQGKSVPYKRQGDALEISLQGKIHNLDSVTIAYSGKPGLDAKGWGGVYFNKLNQIAFNLGVGISTQPHPLGRYWFPCNDTFTDRASFEISVSTPRGMRGFANGILRDSTALGDSAIVWHWKLEEEIPTYLACFAIGPYRSVRDSLVIAKDTILIEWGVDSAKAQFVKADTANRNLGIRMLIENFGPYRWPKIGYVAVPFNGGAMEHATCIAFPLSGINADMYKGTLWLHELSHHWFGDLATCERASEMWLNEGWASFAEYLFLEAMGGMDDYGAGINDLINENVRYAHIADGAYLPIADVPGTSTYGRHVYRKGALAAASLRAQLGENFAPALKAYFDEYQFSSTNTAEFLDALQPFASADLEVFNQEFLQTPGWLGWQILSKQITKAGIAYQANLKIGQTNIKRAHSQREFLLPILFTDGTDTIIKTFRLQGLAPDISITLPFKPSIILLNWQNHFPCPMVNWLDKLNAGEAKNLGFASAALSSSQGVKAFSLTQYWASPANTVFQNQNYQISTQRYWDLQLSDEANSISMTLTFDGRRISGGYQGGWLDDSLPIRSDDSLAILYRPNPNDAWQPVSFTLNALGFRGDKYASLTVPFAKAGQYVFAKKLQATSISQAPRPTLGLYLANGVLTVHWAEYAPHSTVRLYSSLGKKVSSRKISYEENALRQLELPISQLSPGTYIVEVTDGKQSRLVERFTFTE